MNRWRLGLLLAVSALLLAACTPAAARPGWTYDPSIGGGTASTPNAQEAVANPTAATGDVLGTIEVTAADLSFSPNMVTVAEAGRYEVKLTNTGQIQHNLTFADGTAVVADPGKTASAIVNVPSGGLTFSCTIPGHAQAGMTGMVSVGSMPMASGSMGGSMGGSGMTMGSPIASAAPSSGGAANGLGLPAPDPNAPAYLLRDPTAPQVMPGTVHDVYLPIIEKDMTVAAGYVVHVWTFGGTVPGPVIRVHLGDTVHVHLTNEGTMSHSIDFHASQTAMNDQMVEIKPGDTFTYTFQADYAGVWMYHCGTVPALEHIANGMFGMVIVEPKGGLPKVDKELAFVQNEWYLGGQGQIADYAKAASGAPSPDFVTFNGVANQYKDNPISVPTKGRVRVFILDAGPSIDSSFHVVGTIFDTVIKEGIALLPGNAGGWGAQAVDLSPAQGAIIEFSPQEDGMYPFVTHAFNFTVRGAIGVLMAGDGNPKN